MSTRPPPLKVLYTGALGDLSGYAEAARGYVHSLDAVGINVAAEAVTFEPWKPVHLRDEIMDRRLVSLTQKPYDAPIHIIHLTPDNYKQPQFQREGRYKIGYFAWETSKLPLSWVAAINGSVNEVWVPCERLREVSVESGVTVPCFVLPHAIPISSEKRDLCCEFKGLPENRFKFYSVFQWSSRKNPSALIQAYYKEFTRHEPVSLVLKTYRVGNDRRERDFIRREISRIKRETKGVEAPPIILIEDFLRTSDIEALHHSCDCYVSMSRAEGFGIPPVVAAGFGNPVVVPNNWAFRDLFTEERGWLIDVPGEIPIRNMRHISLLYTGDMTWGDPSIASCQKAMREVFENSEEAKRRGKAASEYVEENLSYVAIGRAMKARLEQIYKQITSRG